MKARTLFAGLVIAVGLAAPASAKGYIAEADISGPGLGGPGLGGGGGGGMRIEAPDADRMWEAGIMESGKWDTLADFRMSRSQLGARYTVTYRFEFAFGSGPKVYVAQQELYPYAEGGPVSYTPPGQHLGEEFAEPLPPGWWQAGPALRTFLVQNGLPETNPLSAAAGERPAPEAATQPVPVTQSAPWGWIVLGLAGIAALALLTPGLRRRVLLTVTRMNH